MSSDETDEPDEYQHPTLIPSYSRETEDGSTVSMFDVGNGHAVQVTTHKALKVYTCEIYIIPQFHGASIYNSVKSSFPSEMTFNQDEVDNFIDNAVEQFMVEVKSSQDLLKEFND